MIESPVLQELVGERIHKAIFRVLNARFGAVPPQIAAAVQGTLDETKLDEWIAWAARCPTLDEFRARLTQ